MATGSRGPIRPPNRIVPQIHKKEPATSDINEIFRRINELGSTVEGRRGPIEFKDSGSFSAQDRNTPLKLQGKGDRASGSIAFEGTTGSSMFIAKGAYREDGGSWIATDSSPIILELTATGASPRIYRNTGLTVGNEFSPQPVGYISLATTTGVPITESLQPRNPTPHVHPPQDLLGLDQLFRSNLAGLKPHTHLSSDLPDFVPASSTVALSPFSLKKTSPHTHLFSDLMGTQLLLPNGSAATPAIAFSSQPTLGFYKSATNYCTFGAAGHSLRGGPGSNFTWLLNSSSVGGLYLGSSAAVRWTPGDPDQPGDTILTRAGIGQLSLSTGSQFLLPDGTASAPSLAFNNDTVRGFYRYGSNRIAFGNSGSAVQGWNANTKLLSMASDWGFAIAGTADCMTAASVALTMPSAGQLSLSTGSQFLLPDGTAGAPSLSFASDTDSGLYFASGAFRWMYGGGQKARIESGRIAITTDVSSLAFGVADDVILARDAANTLAQRNGTNAQTFRVYNTFTDAGNYERAELVWSANVARLRIGNAGSGQARQLVIDGATGSTIDIAFGGTGAFQFVSDTLYPYTDSTKNLGGAAFRFKTGYFGGAAASQGIIIKAHASQTANLQEWQDSSGTPMSWVDPSGQIEGFAETELILASQIFGA